MGDAGIVARVGGPKPGALPAVVLRYRLREAVAGAGEINLKTSFAFGDSIQDVPLLETVGNAYVRGDNRELRQLAQQRGWYVISAHDDVMSIVRARTALLFGV